MNSIIREIIRRIHSDEIKVNVCDLNKGLLNKFTGLEEAGSSPTGITFSKLLFSTVSRKKISVIAKIFFDVREGDSNIGKSKKREIEGVYYEGLVYKIINDILANNYSPNFIGSFGFGICDFNEVLKSFDRKTKKKIWDKFHELYYTDKPPTKMGIILNPAVPNPVDLAFVYDELTDNERMAVIFQVVFSLSVMSKYRLMHNDLHYGNFLLSKSEPVKDYIYIADEKNMYRITTNKIPYIFDWDLSYSDLYGKNKKLDNRECLAYGWCNLYREKHDLYLFLCHLGRDIPSEILREMYYPEIVRQRERQEHIHLDDAYPVWKMMEYPSLGDGVYKLYRSQLIDIFGEDWVNEHLPGVLNAFIKVHTAKEISIYSGFSCRSTTNLEGALTPTELLTDSDIFDMFRIYNIPYDFPVENIFRLPKNPKYRRRINIDPRTPSTRQYIKGEPYFPNKPETGYVRTVN